MQIRHVFTSTYDSHAGNSRHMKTIALILTFLVSVRLCQEPTTGYAPVKGLKMYYEVHGKQLRHRVRPSNSVIVSGRTFAPSVEE